MQRVAMQCHRAKQSLFINRAMNMQCSVLSEMHAINPPSVFN